ncbi:MAG: hypothetical protein F6K24_04825 [Okeania sp. SIO2D1]|nr:hypothetical protein [Okeania sp. SIO2D1]
MKHNIWTIGFLTGLILSLSNIDKAVTVRSESVDNLAQSQDIARSAKLTASQLKWLVSIDKKKIELGEKSKKSIDEFKVIVPTFIPPGFNVDDLEIIDNNSELSYRIVYRNSNNSCFYLIKTTNLKPRQPPDYGVKVWEVVEVDSPILGKVYLDYYQSGVISSQSCIRLRTSENIEFESPVWAQKCKVISMQEAVKIIESLQYLNP